MDNKHIVFIESNLTSGIALFGELKKIARLQITFITSSLDFYLKGNPQAKDLLAQCDRILDVQNSTDAKEVTERLKVLHETLPIDGIMTFFDLHVPVAAAVAKQFGLPHLNPKAARLARNKSLMRITCKERGVLQPLFFKVSSEEEAAEIAKHYFPVIVKPSDGSASVNTALASTPEEVRIAYQNIQALSFHGAGVPTTKEVLIEEYVTGPLVSVECVSVAGQHHVLGVTDRLLGQPPFFTELGGSFPSEIEGKDAAIRLAKEALDAIGFDFGASHTEIILSPQGPRLVEVNPRLAGGFVADMISYTLGRNIMVELVRLALGEKVNTNFTPRSVATILAFTTEKTGTLQKISPAEISPTLAKKVLRYFFSKKAGDSVRPPQDNFDRLGYVVAVGEDPGQSYDLARQIRDATQFEIV